MKKIFLEIYKQIMNIPSFLSEKLEIIPETKMRMEYVNAQIEKAISEKSEIIFLLGPFGSGKTTQVNYFFEKNPKYKKKYRSFSRINNLDFAFLHITNYFSRLLFFLFFTAISLLLFYNFPFFGPLPILLIIAGFFTKSFGNLIYIFHESFENLFSKKRKIIVIEDLERSPLGQAEQLTFLANLWRNKRIYLVCLGYDPDEKQKALKLSEFALKLGGTLIELPVYEIANYQMMKRLDLSFPFKNKNIKKPGWLSLFTFRELAMLKEQAIFRSSAGLMSQKECYVLVSFQFLLEKLELENQGVSIDISSKKVMGFSPDKFSASQLQYLASFFESLDESLGIINPFEQDLMEYQRENL